jgi:hypothetical protein
MSLAVEPLHLEAFVTEPTPTLAAVTARIQPREGAYCKKVAANVVLIRPLSPQTFEHVAEFAGTHWTSDVCLQKPMHSPLDSIPAYRVALSTLQGVRYDAHSNRIEVCSETVCSVCKEADSSSAALCERDMSAQYT